MSSPVAQLNPNRITRSLNEPIREGLTVSENFDGPDRGLICCWEQGRRMADKGHEFIDQALAEELPQLTTWRRGTLNYLAVWQGLRGDDLDIDLSEEFTKQCSLTKQPWLFSENRLRRDPEQEKLNARYLKDATLSWCWERGQELVEQGHRLVGPAVRGELADLCLFGRGTLMYYALWQGLRGNPLDVGPKDAFAVQCSKTRRWFVFGPNTRPAQKWKAELQNWLDNRHPDAAEQREEDV